MDYLAVAVRWRELAADSDGALAGKHRVLTRTVAPAMREAAAEGAVALWFHSFWDAAGRYEVPTLRVVCGVEEGVDPAVAGADAGDALSARAVPDDAYDVDLAYDAERLRGYWGGSLDTWVEAKSRLSTLAVAAIEGELGGSYAFHRTVNRPGHVWANMLGCSYLAEAGVYTALARGYLRQLNLGEGPQSDAVREAMAALDAAADHLPDPMRELDSEELAAVNASGTRTPRGDE
ncbi:hypothetical protein [Halobaculum magnesiiphilum]|uniref:Uncharacterized protein n=1 Tax=Halobaculum magnesiiphilum TaxID=1017351 RepID=A0A8T8WDX2_9EURY|nr:hypothetical protein [Halobaculum magnesiiphilum]QZP38050.1 hypothetical protein K6T50_02500 [Halobaculum magnesiiphilum]